MAAYRQWIVYKLTPGKKPGKMDKLPVDFRTSRVASAHDATIWTDAATAMAAAAQAGAGYGVGFTFTAQDPFWFLDIDGCHDGADWSPLSKALVAALPGAAVEVSTSGKGLHLFGTGQVPVHGCTNKALGLEFYTTGRFVALTGINAVGSAATDLSHLMPSLVGQFFPPSTGPEGSDDWTTEPCVGWNGPADDEVLIQRMMRSTSAKAAFGGGASFADLWTANTEVLVRAYPDVGGNSPYDFSAADLALAQHLAFWTGKNCERIQRLMLRSALRRDKWDREDYLEKFTIPKAIARQVEVLTDKLPEPMAGTAAAVAGAYSVANSPNGEPPRAALVTGSTFLTIEQQIDLFAGCVYVRDQHRVLVPGGVMLKEGQFKVAFGGYSFPMDNANERTSRDAWEAFTQSQSFRSPRADASTFRPELPAGYIMNQDGESHVNTYWPIETPRKVGDITPFLVHLAKILPDERDRTIMLSYMAAVVQHKGVKFQWAPLLQGVEGNGKSLFSRCVAFAVGDRYSYFPAAQDLADKFNDWMVGKIFIGVEDIYVPDDRSDVIEAMKPMITSERQQVQGKGKDKFVAWIVCNWILNSNHKNGVRKTDKDRRYAPFFCAQQDAADLVRDGMDGDYFPNLYDWLRKDGYAVVSELLHTYPIPEEFNPATKCPRAPLTSSTEEAVESGRGSVEQEIVEAIEQGLPGFCGGWVSSIMLEKRLDSLGIRRINQNRRKDMLAALGYVLHPGLVDGRVNNMVSPDMGKPRLFIRADSTAGMIVGASSIAAAYAAAQDVQPVPYPTHA